MILCCLYWKVAIVASQYEGKTIWCVCIKLCGRPHRNGCMRTNGWCTCTCSCPYITRQLHMHTKKNCIVFFLSSELYRKHVCSNPLIILFRLVQIISCLCKAFWFFHKFLRWFRDFQCLNILHDISTHPQALFILKIAFPVFSYFLYVLTI